MRLTNIKLAGYKSIKDIDIELKDINILIGANGSGKSNFLSFFRLLGAVMPEMYSYSGRFVAEQGGANVLLHYGAKVTPRIDAQVSFKVSDVLKKVISDISAGINICDINIYDLKLIFDHKDNLLPLENYSPPELHSNLIGAEFVSAMCKLTVYQFHDTSPMSLIRSTNKIHDSSNGLLGDGRNLTAFLFMLKNEYPEYFLSIQRYMRVVAPYIDEILPQQQYDSQSLRLRWRERGQELDISQMSDGTLRALALITLLEQPKLPAILCIDEPELGLHPEVIRLLGSLIVKASERAQIIVSTQSPLLLDCFAAEDVIVCDRDSDGCTSLKRLDTERYKTWLEEYSLSAIWDTNIVGGQP